MFGYFRRVELNSGKDVLCCFICSKSLHVIFLYRICWIMMIRMQDNEIKAKFKSMHHFEFERTFLYHKFPNQTLVVFYCKFCE